jgi:tetratricopeptide (TPR) repeat protein
VPPSRRSLRSTAAVATLAILALGLPLAGGGVAWPAQLAAALLASAALALTARSHRGTTPLAAAALAAVAAVIALQLVPLPAFALRVLSPSAAELFDAVLGPIGLWPSARPVSLDPPATARELAKALACLAAFTAAAHLAARRRGDDLLSAVAASGILVATAVMGAALAGVSPLLEPRLPFVNPNHLSGFLDLSAFVALGFALRARGERRALWALGFILSGAGVFLSLSRGGIAAFFVGTAAFALFYVRRIRSESDDRSFLRVAAMLVAVSATVAVAAWLALDRILAEMSTVRAAASEVKVELWSTALALVRRYPLTGIGRGAFAIAFPAYKTDPSPVTFTHLENSWLQPAIDLGLPAGLLLVAAIAWTWVRAARARDLSRPELGAVAGVAALAAHELFDFSVEVLGVAVPLAVVLGVLSRTQRSISTRSWMVWAAAGVTGAGALLGLAAWRRHPTDEDADRVARASSAAETVVLAQKALRWHPADYLPAAAAGIRLVQEGHCAVGLPWLQRAMLQNPTAADPHRFAARCLAAAGQDALAKREYRLAIALSDPEALSDVMRRYRTLDDLLAIVPDAPGPLLDLGAFLARDRPGDAERVYAIVSDSFGEPAALIGHARVALALGKADAALSLARDYQQRNPSSPDGWLLAAAALRALGRTGDGRAELEAGAARFPGSAAILEPMAEHAIEARHWSEARRCAEAILATEARAIASKRILIARVLLEEGRISEALQNATVARDILPDEASTQVFFADACARAGRYDDAIAALTLAATLPGKPGVVERRLAEIRAARDEAARRRLLGASSGGP